MEFRVGIGVDAHRFAPGTRLVLGGVEIPFDRGLVGHSDGDVVTHALIDALLGAASLGDIGSLFPSDDPDWEGSLSLDLLRQAYEQVRDGGFALVNADCVLIAEEPKIAPYRDEMRGRLAGAMAAEPERVSVRATTTDELGFTGRGEGMAAHAVALLAGES
jgi:2-C-methyl-D-erythritol 2,4-cyclodiphosphate synthase